MSDSGEQAPTPDYTQMAAASDHAADVAKELGEDQLKQNKEQYDNNMAVAAPVVKAQTDLMNTQNAQSNDYYNYMQQYSRPDEQALYYDAMGFNPDEIAQVEALRSQETQGATPDATGTTATPQTNALVAKLAASAGVRQQQEAADTAIADSRKGTTDTTNQAIRQGIRYGFSADKLAAATAGMDTQQAQAQAAAASAARTTASNTNFQKKMDVDSLYRNLPGASQAAAGLSVNAGNAAVANTNGTSQQYMTGINQGNSTILTGTGQQVSGLGSLVNAQTSYANSINSQQSGGDGFMNVLGQLGGAAITKWSDKNVKENIKPTDDDEALEAVNKTPVKTWNYDQGKLANGDTKTHIGPMAQDVKKNMGDAAAPGGRMIDLINMNGITMNAIKALDKKVSKLENAKGAR